MTKNKEQSVKLKDQSSQLLMAYLFLIPKRTEMLSWSIVPALATAERKAALVICSGHCRTKGQNGKCLSVKEFFQKNLFSSR
jgi:hypothetical protein